MSATPATRPSFTSEQATQASARGKITLALASKKTLMKHAARIEEITFEALEELSAAGDDQDQSEEVRARAGAIANVVRGWDAACERIRILRGEPMPGSRRPAPEKEKQPKRKGVNRPPARPMEPSQVQPASPPLVVSAPLQVVEKPLVVIVETPQDSKPL